LSNKEIQSFYCDDVVFEFFHLYSYIDKNLLLFSNNITNDFELLKDISNSTILISNNKKFIKDIQPLSKNLYKKNQHITNLTQHSIFYTTFSYKNNLYSRIRLPSIYIDDFLLVQDFLDLPLDISRLKNFQYFNPIFVNKHLEIVDFGKSNKFILANKNKNIIDNELKFLITNYSYAKIIVIDKYQNNKDLFNQIKTCDFNALYIKGKSKEKIDAILKENQRELSKLI
jgi:ferrochelatase